MERLGVADVAQIIDFWHEFSAAFSAGDLDGWMALWSADGIQLAPDAPPRKGTETIRSAMQPLFDSHDLHMTVHPEEVRVLGDHAFTHGQYQVMLQPRTAGRPVQGEGKFLTILKKQADGSWRILIDSFSYNAPLS